MDPRASFFGNLQFVQGVGYVEKPCGCQGPGCDGSLGDENAVMMISGLGSDPNFVAQQPPVAVKESPLRKAVSWLTQSQGVFGIQLPLWVWILIAAGVLGAGFAFFRSRQK